MNDCKETYEPFEFGETMRLLSLNESENVPGALCPQHQRPPLFFHLRDAASMKKFSLSRAHMSMSR